MTDVIRFDTVSKRFGRQVALENVSFQVPPGVVFALLGENGAGKSTAIRILLGLEQAGGGDVHVLDLDSRRHGLQIRRRVGYLPERPTLYDWMTVREIGWFTAGFHAVPFLPAYLRQIQRFEVPVDRRLRHLSKGMRAKVALALAMAHHPELLILDEPTSGLDTMVRREFLESMVEVAAEGRTVFLSSHQIGEVERVADIVAILHDGRLLLVERLDNLKQTTLDLTITVTDGEVALPPIAGEIARTRHRRQWQVLARGLSDGDLAALRGHAAVVAVESRTPQLEEIFVAYMQSDLPPGPPSSRSAADEEVVAP